MTQKTIASDFNLTKISTKDLSDNLRATVDFGGNVFIAGRRGSGKSVIAKDCIKHAGHREVYINLSTSERVDLGGYPNFFGNKERKYVDFLLPQWFEPLIEGNEPAVLLLDEVDKCESSLWAPLLELTQFHTINGRPLPNLKAVIMTANLQAEGGQRPCLPLLDRAEKYLLETSIQHWQDWAAKGGEIHSSIAAFLNDHPDELFGDVDPGDVYADPSPRGWHNASKILQFGEDKKWPHKILTNKVSGCIGKKTGIKYSAYFDHYQILLPIVEKIMKGQEVKGFKDLEVSKIMVCGFIVCSRFARMLDTMKNKELPKETEHVAKFLKILDPEMALISVRSQIGLERVVSSTLDEHPTFDVILREIAKRINGN
jgi:hypothetical protein